MLAKWIAFYGLWITPAVLLALLAAAMRRRGLDRQLPAFFCYAVFSAFRTPVLFYVFHRHPLAYSYLYWVAEAGSAVLGFTVLYEVFRQLYREQEGPRRLGDFFFRWTAAAFVLLAVVAAASNRDPEITPLAAAVLALTQGVRLVQCGLVLFLFVFSFFSGSSWRSQPLGIALGFGVFAGVQLVSAAAEAQTGMVNSRTWMWVNMVSYNCAVLVWVRYVLVPARAVEPARAQAVAEVKSWNQALLQLLQR